MLDSRKLKVRNTLPVLIATTMLGVCEAASAGSSGASLVFNYSNGFANETVFGPAWEAKKVGSAIALTYAPDGDHRGGSAWYQVQQNIQSFTTDFTFQQQSTAIGMTFCIQNTNSSTNANYGTGAIGDANADGYGTYSFQPKNAIANSVAIAFDVAGYEEDIAFGPKVPSVATLYLNGAPTADSAAIPVNDLNPYGISLGSGDVMAAHIVYDGAILTMVLVDTVTNAQARYSWPVNIPAATGSNTAWVGFTGGTVLAATQSVLSWDFYTGFNSRLANPTFSIAAGSYPSAQSVTIAGPPGAAIYYTTNGLLPTSASTRYTGPVTVNSNEVIQAVAIESGYTDSYVASANYEIAPAGSPYPINFPAGFSKGDGVVLAGYSQLNGSTIRLTDSNAPGDEVGAAWYAVPVNVQSFSTNFTLQFTNAAANGMAFVIQNQTAPSLDGVANSSVSGGPTALGFRASGLGYQGIASSIAITFDIYGGNVTGLYFNGNTPNTSAAHVPITGITLNSGHPLNVGLTYNGTTLSMKMTDTVTSSTFSQSWAVNIPSTVGNSTAYVGFTGATGGVYANQDVLSWVYTAGTQSTPAVPAAPTNLRVQ